MIVTAAELQVPYILMHARGTSQTMNSLAEYPRGVVTEVVEELTGLRERFLAAGVLPQNLILDPGLGFAKGGMQDWELLAAIDELQGWGTACSLPVPASVLSPTPSRRRIWRWLSV